MRLLFVHQNFPGQYRHLAAHYAQQPGCEVVAVGDRANLQHSRPNIPGLKLMTYSVPAAGRAESSEARLQAAIARGRRVAVGAAQLARAGFRPDVIFTHLGWGEGLFLKDIFPDARVLLYCEFFYRARGADAGFDPEFSRVDPRIDPGIDQTGARTRVLNAPLLMALDACDWGLAPTEWQKRQFPAAYQPRISVIHDGIDSDVVAPRADARFRVPRGCGSGTLELTRRDEVVTYVARNLEPYRGFHRFMRAIPEIQRRRPQAQIVIVGGDEVSYSPRPREGGNYRTQLLAELAGKIDLARVHFTGRIAYQDYLALLRVSSAHVYLTYPFVLSWSLIEALSAGCLVIASRTPPVEEVIRDGKNGLLVDFFSADELAARVEEAIVRQRELGGLRAAARRTALERYDLKRVCLPAQLELIERLAETGDRPRFSTGATGEQSLV
jgi:glycosyltransferase involved in cell wall biosynthesis